MSNFKTNSKLIKKIEDIDALKGLSPAGGVFVVPDMEDETSGGIITLGSKFKFRPSISNNNIQYGVIVKMGYGRNLDNYLEEGLKVGVKILYQVKKIFPLSISMDADISSAAIYLVHYADIDGIVTD